ncbi:hypothetical protein SUGI_1007380 [Cryptomeria japonica]|uniref:UPF0481 protein At3g47200 n=1 Tax=Cryptomeria japonica TaxID=3369 RepID=UPI002414B881|nr:UPF0481 protein At3g47200 [Cryptomeria japonica]XP_057858099.2 UPF0481 protein At3g47200 [Cryptomeria japonica]GLJ47701.1 hypothetical protein SUGI_1007380 [Cryptomeria japonica]
MEAENNIATVKIDIQNGERQGPLEVNREPESWFDKLKLDPAFINYKNRKTSADVSIYRVPEIIKKANREAYDPLVVFLGPFHHKKDQQMTVMDEYKLQAVDRTVERIPNMTREHLVDKVKELHEEIRDCYEDSANEWDDNALVSMMTMDACFILEFLQMDMPNSSLVFHSHRANSIKRGEILMDILKLENQIPLCILKKILKLELKDPVAFLADTLNRCMGCYFQGYPFKENKHNEDLIAKFIKGGAFHLLDLSRQVIADFLSDSNSGCKADNPIKSCACIATPNGVGCFRGASWEHIIRGLRGSAAVDGSMMPSAEKLEEAGIKLKQSTGGKVHFKRRFLRSSTLYLPQIIVDDNTEIFLRNLIALEECQMQENYKITRVISLNLYRMDCLIDSREDVGLFRKARIIKNYLGSDKQVAKMFNALCVGITEEHDLKDVLTEVHEHYDSKLKVWMSEFRKEHCSSPWYIISLVAAVILVVLTLLQTIYTMESYFKS